MFPQTYVFPAAIPGASFQLNYGRMAPFCGGNRPEDSARRAVACRFSAHKHLSSGNRICLKRPQRIKHLRPADRQGFWASHSRRAEESHVALICLDPAINS